MRRLTAETDELVPRLQPYPNTRRIYGCNTNEDKFSICNYHRRNPASEVARNGLRLGEAMAFSWNEGDPLSLEVSGEDVFVRIQAEGEKGLKDRRHVLTPDASAYLLRAHPLDRAGRVFKVARVMQADQSSRIICKIGEKANVGVNKEQGKFASAHDLRRAFATRWARLVQPMVLKEVMRHDDIDTTMKFYVESRSEELASMIRKVYLLDGGEVREGNG